MIHTTRAQCYLAKYGFFYEIANDDLLVKIFYAHNTTLCVYIYLYTHIYLHFIYHTI